ncbi:protein kinase domain-containing protein [Ditylenchus destructor]|nr:protein kinase domain-containing protein [Ditylenchus destructor]
MDNTQFDKGKVVNGKWLVDSRIGEGCCGIVFKVRDVNNPKIKGAMKVEPRDEAIEVLKNEVRVLKLLRERKNVVRLIDAGKRANYSYLVMSLLGDSITQVKKECKLEKFSAGSVSRIGIQALYAIKQLHEVGYVHRDIKPSNLVLGRRGKESRMIFLIDYGLARSFVVWEDSQVRIRQPRPHAFLRGTTRYCSPAVHERKEQGRKDDLWGMMYLMVELQAGLPWVRKPEDETKRMKCEMPDSVLMATSPPEWIRMMDHIRNLKYESRPDYRLLYDMLTATMARLKITFADPYDWEEPSMLAKLQSKQWSGETTEETRSMETGSNDSRSISVPLDGNPFPNTAEFDSNDLHL